MYISFKFCYYALACLAEIRSSSQGSEEIHPTVSLITAMSCPSVVHILMCLISGAILENTMKSCCLSSCCLSLSHIDALSIQILVPMKKAGKRKMIISDQIKSVFRIV